MKRSAVTGRLSPPAVLLLLLLFLGACATPEVSLLAQRWPSNLPASAQLGDVPFYPQEDYQCGPAALAMAASAAGVPLRPEDLVEQVYVPARKGSLQLEMLAAGRRHGLLTYQITPTVEAMLREVAAGNPVIVLQNLSFSFRPVWHYAVVVGFDRARNALLLHSGRNERMPMSLFTFERTWERAQKWAMLALPPARLPTTADPEAYVAAVAALERVTPAAAAVAYRAALENWPSHRILWLGAGNAAYASGQLDEAADAYRALVTLHPDFADAWNNLAQVMLDKGKLGDALAAIRQAISIGGVRVDRYLRLQREIQARLRA